MFTSKEKPSEIIARLAAKGLCPPDNPTPSCSNKEKKTKRKGKGLKQFVRVLAFLPGRAGPPLEAAVLKGQLLKFDTPLKRGEREKVGNGTE